MIKMDKGDRQSNNHNTKEQKRTKVLSNNKKLCI